MLKIPASNAQTIFFGLVLPLKRNDDNKNARVIKTTHIMFALSGSTFNLSKYVINTIEIAACIASNEQLSKLIFLKHKHPLS